MLQNRKIVVVNLSKGRLNESASRLFGGCLVAFIQAAALARPDPERSPLFSLILDEFQTFCTPTIVDVLSESRKYHLSLIMAHQFMHQLSSVPKLKEAVLNTTGTIAVFRVGQEDAAALVHDVFPSGYLEWSAWEIGWGHLFGYPIPLPRRVRQPLTREELVMLLAYQSPRRFWLKRRGPYPPQHLRTLDMPPLAITDELARAREDLARISGERYGILKSVAQREADEETAVATQTIDGQYRILNDWEQS